MFDAVGSFASKYRYPVILAWVLLLVVVTLIAPDINEVAVSDQAGYLSPREPSIVAAKLAEDAFPEQSSASQAVIVLQSTAGKLSDEPARGYISGLIDWLEGTASPGAVGQVLSPLDPELSERLTGDDGRVGMMLVSLVGSTEGPEVTRLLGEIEQRLREAPPEVKGYLTGSVAIVRDYKRSALDSAASTTRITILLVVAVLLAIYRSPVLPLVPLATIAAAYGITRGLVAYLTRFGWMVSSMTDVFLVVLLFGAGTDYCLFMISRFREFVADDMSGVEAARNSVGRVGETIASSAGTVIVGTLGMAFAEMRLFSNTGPSLAIGLVVALLAGLTLTPALLAALGRHAFWPGRARHAPDGNLWGRLARGVTSRPWVPLALAVVVLLPLAVYGRGQQRTFDLLADLEDGAPAKAGFVLLSSNLGAGEMQPLDVTLAGLSGARGPRGMAQIAALTRDLLAVSGVADVRSLTLPLGKDDTEAASTLRVETQLAFLSDKIETFRGRAGDASAMADLDVEQALADVAAVRAYLAELEAAFPDVSGNANYVAIVQTLDKLEPLIESSADRLLLSVQLQEVAGQVAAARTRSAEASSSEAVEATTEELALLAKYLADAAAAHPALAELTQYGEAQAALGDMREALGEARNLLLVSTQLDALAAALHDAASAAADPSSWAEVAGGDPASSMAALTDYVCELADAYPQLAVRPELIEATQRLDVAAELGQTMLLSRQLKLVAAQMADKLATLESDPLSLLPQADQPSASEQMAVLTVYLDQVGATFPDLAAEPDYSAAVAAAQELGAALEEVSLANAAETVERAKVLLAVLQASFSRLAATAASSLPEATFVPRDLPGDAAAMAPDLSGVANELASAGDDFAALAEFARQELPDATFVPATQLPDAEVGAALAARVQDDLGNLVTALESLAASAAEKLPEATFVPSEGPLAAMADDVVWSVTADLDTLQAAREALEQEFARRPDGYLVPLALASKEERADLERALDAYSTADGTAARLQVVLADEPFSPAALDTTSRIRARLDLEPSGYVSGSSAVMLDMRDVMERDLQLVQVLVLGGIGLVLVLLLRSLVAPVYLIATILLSYAATLGLTRLVFEVGFGQPLTWWVPFFMFTLLVALGMDYNIFLMGRVKEEVAERGTRAGVAGAVQHTGGVITSAGIIMAGTFAAMMSSSLIGLVQLAFAVTVGVLLDTFVIRTTLVPAIVVLLGRANWWPWRR